MADVAHKHMPGSGPSHVPWPVLWKWIFWRSDRHCRKLRHTKLLPGESAGGPPNLKIFFSLTMAHSAPILCCHSWISSPFQKNGFIYISENISNKLHFRNQWQTQKPVATKKTPSSTTELFCSAQLLNPLPRKLIKGRGINLSATPASKVTNSTPNLTTRCEFPPKFSWEPKVPPPKLPPINKALLRD